MSISSSEIYVLIYIRKESKLPQTPVLGSEDRLLVDARQALCGWAASPAQRLLFLHLTQAKNQIVCCLYSNECDLPFLGWGWEAGDMFWIVPFEISKLSVALKTSHIVQYFILELRHSVWWGKCVFLVLQSWKHPRNTISWSVAPSWILFSGSRYKAI